MTLRLHNTLTRTKEDFVPLDAKNVRMYVCGPTVYDFAHIGNARPVIVFDVLFRLLRHLYGEAHVTYVRNITDIDDKIYARAGERGIPIRELTDETYKQYSDDVAALGCLSPTYEPRATDHIEEMKDIVERLVSSEHAYVADEHVLFSVPSMPEYGQLSKRPLDEMIAGARVDVAPYKRSPMDFVLWKPSDQRQTNYRIPAWPSPRKIETPGRPGWHLECSAMAWKFLKETFDIHGGGIDLVFPHHENEIAQSRCAFHTSFMAKYWMHNGFLNVEGDKMSKSLGNFVTIRQLMRGWRAQAWSAPVLRLAMLKTHYRQPINWNFRLLDETKRELAAWLSSIERFQVHEELLSGRMAAPNEEVIAALLDDLGTPDMVSVLHRLHQSATKGDRQSARSLASSLVFIGVLKPGLIRAYRQGVSSEGDVTARELLDSFPIGEQLKVSLLNNDKYFQLELEQRLATKNLRANYNFGSVCLDYIQPSELPMDDEIRDAINARNNARKAKNFKEADRIRDELLAQGVILEDNPDGTTTPRRKQ